MDTQFEALLGARDYRAALTLLAEAYATPVGRFCAGLMGSAADGEELLQETMIAALEAMPRYRGAAGVRPWIYGIARRVCAAALRKRRRRAGLRERWPSPTPVTPDGASSADARLALGPALDALRPRLREAVLLRYQQGFDATEVAVILGTSHAAARKRISKGISALRDTLAARRPHPAQNPEVSHETHDPLRARPGVRVIGS